jgi:hypothetical protein
MSRARFLVALLGVSIPYLARIPGTFSHGPRWFTSYLQHGIAGFLFLGGFNAIVWGTLIGLSYSIRKPGPLIIPSIAGFGLLAYAHAQIDLASNARAGVALVFVPIYALPFVVLGFAASVAVLGRGLPTKSQRGLSPNRVRPARAHGVASGQSFECPSCGAIVCYGASHCRECDEDFG